MGAVRKASKLLGAKREGTESWASVFYRRWQISWRAERMSASLCPCFFEFGRWI